MSIVLNKSFICSEGSDANHNKFWKVQVTSDGYLTTEYGRVGDSGATTKKDFGSEEKALKEANKLIAKKTKGKNNGKGGRDSVYKEIEIVCDSNNNVSGPKISKVSLKSIANGDPVVEILIDYLHDQNIHNITNNTNIKYDSTTGLFSTPLGVVGQKNIDSARDILAKIKPFIGQKTPEGNKLAEEFMMFIPQDIGRSRPTLENICRNEKKYDELNSILDSLQASLDMVSTKVDEIGEEVKFGVSLSTLNDDKEFDRITKFYNKNKGKHECSHLNINKVFKIQHDEMTKGWNKVGSKMNNIVELFHGSRVGNILSILSKGFFIPPASASYCTGRMWGNGIYFADCSTKSLQYAYGTWGNKSRDNSCFMFICDVALGKTYEPTNTIKKIPQGYNSISALSSKASLRYNEFIVDQINQINLKYLIQFKENK